VSGPRFDALVLGGGTAGCVVASRLSEEAERSVCLVEAGPDYGPHGSHWPADMLDSRLPPSSHDWSDGEHTLSAARIMGGCSSHNMCILARGAPDDYAAWGDEGWSYEGLVEYFDRAERQLEPVRVARDDLNPWTATVVAACEEVGIPVHDDLNVADAVEGFGPVPVNVRGSTRWNAAFAYLDPARERPNLTLMAETLVDRARLSEGRATGAVVVREGEAVELEADLVVVCGGSYGSAAMLLRSGVGPADELSRHGIEPLAELPVGERLLDHFGVPVRWSPSERLQQSLFDHAAQTPLIACQGLIKARSSDCAEGIWDLHLLTGLFPANGGHVLAGSAMLLQPEWRGTVRLRSAAPAVLPEVTDYAFDSDADLAHALEGVELGRRLAGSVVAEGLVERELEPGESADADAIRHRGRDGISAYFHPVGTCAMGEVTDHSGRVLGFENLVVADASLMPAIPRAGTNLTVLAVAERVADLLGD
jgi:choline dehydrogenase-like flavoprotein